MHSEVFSLCFIDTFAKVNVVLVLVLVCFLNFTTHHCQLIVDF